MCFLFIPVASEAGYSRAALWGRLFLFLLLPSLRFCFFVTISQFVYTEHVFVGTERCAGVVCL